CRRAGSTSRWPRRFAIGSLRSSAAATSSSSSRREGTASRSTPRPRSAPRSSRRAARPPCARAASISASRIARTSTTGGWPGSRRRSPASQRPGWLASGLPRDGTRSPSPARSSSSAAASRRRRATRPSGGGSGTGSGRSATGRASWPPPSRPAVRSPGEDRVSALPARRWRRRPRPRPRIVTAGYDRRPTRVAVEHVDPALDLPAVRERHGTLDPHEEISGAILGVEGFVVVERRQHVLVRNLEHLAGDHRVGGLVEDRTRVFSEVVEPSLHPGGPYPPQPRHHRRHLGRLLSGDQGPVEKHELTHVLHRGASLFRRTR